MAWQPVSFPDGSNNPHVKFPHVPKPPPGAKGGVDVTRHKSPLAIPLSDDDEPVSSHDRADVPPNSGPQSVPAPKAQDPGDGLPPEWLGRRTAKLVDHD